MFPRSFFEDNVSPVGNVDILIGFGSSTLNFSVGCCSFNCIKVKFVYCEKQLQCGLGALTRHLDFFTGLLKGLMKLIIKRLIETQIALA